MKYADRKENFVIFSDKAKYNKIEEVFITFGNSKAEHNFNRLNSSNFKFDKKNILTADKNVEFFDQENNSTIYSDKAIYNKTNEIIITEGNSKAISENNIISASISNSIRKNILTADKNVEFLIKRIIQQFIQTKLFITKQMK